MLIASPAPRHERSAVNATDFWHGHNLRTTAKDLAARKFAPVAQLEQNGWRTVIVAADGDGVERIAAKRRRRIRGGRGGFAKAGQIMITCGYEEDDAFSRACRDAVADCDAPARRRACRRAARAQAEVATL